MNILFRSAAAMVFVLLFSSSGISQQTKRDSIWLLLNPFVGTWKGEGGGEPGNGAYERTYRFVLGKNFIEVRNRAAYPPSARQPQGEVHEDEGYFSYDKSLKKFRLRQFHVEGFVNEYILDSISTDSKTLVFITESIENIPKGWRGKETYRFINENEFEELFELAGPGKEFSLYTKVRFHRQP